MVMVAILAGGTYGRTFMMDTEEITARETIAQRLFYESSIVLLFLVIIIFRYVCGIIYGRKYSELTQGMTGTRKHEKRNESGE